MVTFLSMLKCLYNRITSPSDINSDNEITVVLISEDSKYIYRQCIYNFNRICIREVTVEVHVRTQSSTCFWEGPW
jgi:hypothetical protein